MKKAIRFDLEGVINSYRIPFFRTYHKTLLAPPKTAVLGLLCNISLKPQKDFFEILNNDQIEISVIINKIEGKLKDLWSYKTLDKDNRGKSVIRRDKLFNTYYTIYLNIQDKSLYKEFLTSLKSPKNIPSLGLDDELVIIKDIKEILLEDNIDNKINSVFIDEGNPYKAFVKDLERIIELPTTHILPIKFKAFNDKNKRISKEVIEEVRQVEYTNCIIEFQNNIKSYFDKERNNKLVFY